MSIPTIVGTIIQTRRWFLLGLRWRVSRCSTDSIVIAWLYLDGILFKLSLKPAPVFITL
jgi:hypothetical protein